MQVTFPDENDPADTDGEKLARLMSMLDIEGGERLRIRSFALVLAQPKKPFKYVGRMIQLFDVRGNPLALARQVYGQHIVGGFGESVAEKLASQVGWLTEQAPNFEPHDSFIAVILIAPNRGDLRLALSKKRTIDVAYVVAPTNNSSFELSAAEVYSSQIAQDLENRLAVLAETQRQFGGNFQGLPA